MSAAEGGEGSFPPLSPPDVNELTDEQVDKQNALKQAGAELLEDGNLEGALAKFSEAVVVGCASALLYSRRAAVLWKLDRPRAVINDCSAALAVNPDSAKAYKMRARAKAKLNLWEEANLDFQTGLKIDFDEETEEESKIAAAKAKEIRDATVQERVQKEAAEYEAKLRADKEAYAAAMKAREEVWTDAKEQKYQETCRKAEEEKKRREQKAQSAKETPEMKAAAKEAAEKEAAEKAAAEKKAAEKRLFGSEGERTGGYASAADASQSVAEDPKTVVAQSWAEVHKVLPDENARVPRDVFVTNCKKLAGPVPESHTDAFDQFVNSLFDTGTALMLPAEKTDLGKHCFGYATLMVPEFYGEKPKDALALAAPISSRPDDGLSDVRSALDEDWAKVEKNADGRVTKEAFVNHFMDKFREKLVEGSAPQYRLFLETNFKSSCNMMLPEEKDSLGGHCFRYGAVMAGEFYFDAAKDAATGCGCSAPVADVLGITK